jgi:hypothetical protein
MIRDVHRGSGSLLFPILNPGSRGQKGTGSRIRNTGTNDGTDLRQTIFRFLRRSRRVGNFCLHGSGSAFPVRIRIQSTKLMRIRIHNTGFFSYDFCRWWGQSERGEEETQLWSPTGTTKHQRRWTFMVFIARSFVSIPGSFCGTDLWPST